MAEVQELLEKHAHQQPRLGAGVFLAPSAMVMGDVSIGEHSSVWYGAVIRADIGPITIGHHANVQDNAVVHVDPGFPTTIGNWVTIGHGAIIHGCEIGDECLIGMGATILDGAQIGAQCIIGANALVAEGAIIPPRSLALGLPARVVRPLHYDEWSTLKKWAQHYVDNAAWRLHQPSPSTG